MGIKNSNAKQKIKNALISLIINQPYESITITDIARTAKINRSTYYYYYYRKEEILNDIIVQCTHDLIDAIKSPYIRVNELEINDTVLPSTTILFEYVYQHRIFFKALLNCELSPAFQEYFIEVLGKYFSQCLVTDYKITRIEKDISTSFHAYGILGMIIKWVNDDFSQHPSYIAEQYTYILDHKMEKIQINL